MKTFVIDIAERTGATFALAFLSAFSFSDLSTAHDALIAGAAAAGSIIKGLLASYLGQKPSASLADLSVSK